MDDLKIAASDETPEISFLASGELMLNGYSMPEDPTAFFTPIITWTKEFVSEFSGSDCRASVHLTYFNSTSAKRIFQILFLLEGLIAKGVNVQIEWLYDEDDDLIKDKGEEISQLLQIPVLVKQA